jgi:hypothetical protein
MALLDQDSIITILQDPSTKEDRAFEIAKNISRFVNTGGGRGARELVIRALDREDVFARLPGVLDALARQVGLFPYAQPNALGARDRIAFEYHRPVALRLHDREIVFHIANRPKSIAI